MPESLFFLKKKNEIDDQAPASDSETFKSN